MSERKEFLSVAETAHRISMSPWFVRQRIAEGELDGYNLSANKVVVSQRSIDRFMERRRIKTTEEMMAK
jgi:hypothetical protein